jgi:hypothetical protein
LFPTKNSAAAAVELARSSPTEETPGASAPCRRLSSVDFSASPPTLASGTARFTACPWIRMSESFHVEGGAGWPVARTSPCQPMLAT